MSKKEKELRRIVFNNIAHMSPAHFNNSREDFLEAVSIIEDSIMNGTTTEDRMREKINSVFNDL